MRAYIFSAAILSALAWTSSIANAADRDTSAAQAAATVWLSKLDANQFSDCWDLLASDFKKTVPRWKWNLECKMGRVMMGTARDRTLISAKPSKRSPGGRTGEFVLFEYKTTSAKKGDVTERVPVQKDHDDEWRVCGYEIGQNQ